MAFWWYGVLCFSPARIVWNSGHLSSSRWVICDGLPIIYLVLSLIPACLGQYIHRNLWRCWDLVILFPLIQQVSDSISTGWLVETSLEWQEHFSQFQDATDVLPCHIHLHVCLWGMNPHSSAAKKNTSHRNEMLLQDTKHLIQRPCYQWGSLCEDPAGNQTTKRPPVSCSS